MTDQLPVPSQVHKVPDGPPSPTATIPWSRELIKEIAMDIGKDVVAYVQVQYPKAVEATSSTFRLSLRNCIYNQIMAAIDVNDASEIADRLKERKKFRRQWTAAWKKIRQSTEEPDLVGAALALHRANQGWSPEEGEYFNVRLTPGQRDALLTLLPNQDGE